MENMRSPKNELMQDEEEYILLEDVEGVPEPKRKIGLTERIAKAVIWLCGKQSYEEKRTEALAYVRFTRQLYWPQFGVEFVESVEHDEGNLSYIVRKQGVGEEKTIDWLLSESYKWRLYYRFDWYGKYKKLGFSLLPRDLGKKHNALSTKVPVMRLAIDRQRPIQAIEAIKNYHASLTKKLDEKGE